MMARGPGRKCGWWQPDLRDLRFASDAGLAKAKVRDPGSPGFALARFAGIPRFGPG